MKATLLTTLAISFSLTAVGITTKEDTMTWDKTFPKSDKVDHQKVSYPNRYGITVSADMYLPKDIDLSAKHAALIVGTPYGGVKEQGAGLYAQTMAERGFVTTAFDESFNGESSGAPRHVSSPDIFVEDFSAGVDFLGTRPFVDRNRIGAIGICGSGGFAVTAAQVDHRIKAVATASMYDMSRTLRKGWEDSMTDEQRDQVLDQLSAQRWQDFEKDSPEVPPGFPSEPLDAVPEGLDPVSSEFFEYYGMARGHHPRAHGPFTQTSALAFMNFPLMNYIDTISPRPLLFIIGENAHSRYFTEDAYKAAAEPKELYIVPGARHIDLYDRTDMIPFDKLKSFFTDNLSGKQHSTSDVLPMTDKEKQTMNTPFNGETVFPKGPENVAYAKYFTGNSYLEMLSLKGLVIGNVTFEPGCRNFWHIHHKGGQVLLVTGGRGWYQEAGKPAQALSAGDVVNIPPETKHWHGATSDSWFTHLAVEVPAEGASNEWLEPVSDEEYDALAAK